MSEYFLIGTWLAKKMTYHQNASHRKVLRKQLNQGEIWECDFGFNIGQEKNKKRRVIILSNNKVNRTGKVLVAPITNAFNKTNQEDLPQHNTWMLIYTDSQNQNNWFRTNREVPKSGYKYSWLTKDSVIQCEEMRSVSKARIVGNKLGEIEEDDLTILKRKIKKVFDIN